MSNKSFCPVCGKIACRKMSCVYTLWLLFVEEKRKSNQGKNPHCGEPPHGGGQGHDEHGNGHGYGHDHHDHEDEYEDFKRKKLYGNNESRNKVRQHSVNPNEYPPHCGCPPEPCPEPLGCLVALWLIFSLLVFFVKESFAAIFQKKNDVISQEKPKIAFISVYKTKCGVATYNEALVKRLRKKVDLHVFAEYADEEQSERLSTDPEWVTRCWSRHEHPKKRLINAVLKYKPNLVHFSHEYGFFMRAYLFTALVSAFRERKIKVLSTMHSVYDHLDKTVQESFSDFLVVHTDNAKTCLMDKGIEDKKIHVIPHGSNILAGTESKPELLPKLWNTWDAPVLFQPGFLFHYKGHMKVIDILPKLKEKYPNIHYVIQGSENEFNMREHNELYCALVNRAKELGVEASVSINRGFVSEKVLLSYIRTAACCVLPYANNPAHDVYATSGIARMILATETPLVVSKVHLFDDLEGIAPRAQTLEELYQCIDDVLSNKGYIVDQIEARKQLLKSTGWRSIAKQYVVIYNSLVK